MVPSLGDMKLVGIINFMINIPLFVMGFKIMNKEFCIKTVISLVVQTITLSILPKQSFVIMPDMLSNCIFGACAFIFDLQTSLYSIIFVAILYFISDRIHYQNINMTVLIFTKKENMKNVIMERTGRGVTYWMGKGAYTDTEQYILFCAVNKYEIRNFKKIVNEIDPKAFVTISEDQEIDGGFEKRL